MAIKTVDKMPALESQKEFVIGCHPDDEQKSTVIMHVGTYKDKKAVDCLKIELQSYMQEKTKEEKEKLKVILKKVKDEEGKFDATKILDLTEEELNIFKDKLKDESKYLEVEKLKEKILRYEIMLGKPIIDGKEYTLEDLENLPDIYSNYILSELHAASMEMNNEHLIELAKKKL